MFEQGLFITAELRVHAAYDLDEAKAAIDVFCAGMNREPGCSFAMATQDRQDPRRFIFWERYDDQAAFEAHFHARHTQEFIGLGITELVRAFESHQ
ncbi:putative quinol monooxygenase [Photobacterium atrarenae]|uniref:Antibiotic biosynthesis monooxygenase n=1 Tax=Photobacterium atrarenae TaxID=865757 RepID=A0ABY5GNV5_9GAMM|nr:antibiotic biosynthesis monooxygenase [Photobacterium atrarenae]UTV30831.1 antibiotic biosynthesis monooxygenase [Photobacterium atrarenae]